MKRTPTSCYPSVACTAATGGSPKTRLCFGAIALRHELNEFLLKAVAMSATASGLRRAVAAWPATR